MGTFSSTSYKETPQLGDNLESKMTEFIKKSQNLLEDEDFNSKNSQSHLRVKESINKDLQKLKKCTEKGGNLKIGIISRSENTKDFLKALYLSEIHTDQNSNTLISSKNINHLTILNNHNLNLESQETLSKLISSSFYPSTKKSEDIVLTRIFGENPDIIHDNLIVTCSSNLKTINSHFHSYSENTNKENIATNSSKNDFSFNPYCEQENFSNFYQPDFSKNSTQIEIDMDDMSKFLLFSALHDLLIYLPDCRNYRNEISYLDLLSDNMLILKLLRRGNFFMVNEKNSFNSKDIDTKLNDLIVKLGKTVIHQLNYEKAEEDKVKYLGVMIEKYGSRYVKNISYSVVERIKTKFEVYLRNNEYKDYLQSIKDEEKIEEEKFWKDPKYEKKKIEKMDFFEFKRNFVKRFFTNHSNTSEKFSTNSGIDCLEENLTNSFLQIINNKFSLLRSNICFKINIFQNLEELEACNDFMNSLIITRSQIVEDIENSFSEISGILENEENYLINSCDDLMNSIINIRKYALTHKEQKSFLDIFNFKGDFVPYNENLSKLRKNYFSFNGTIFITITKISNVVYKILDFLTRRIANQYTNLFMEIEKKTLKKILSASKSKLNNSINYLKKCDSLFHIDNLSINEIILSKIENINLLSINLFSAFGFSNFTLDKVFPYYLIPSYIGPGIVFILGFLKFSKAFGIKITNLGFTLTSSIILFSSYLLSNYLQSKFRQNSKENFLINSEKLLNFMTLKKDKIKNLKNDVDDFCKIYSKETLELIDLVLGIEKI